MEPEAEKTAGVVTSVRRVLATVLGIASNRLELLAVEAREEVYRWVSVLLLSAAIGVVGMLAVVMISLTVVAACWDEHRMAAMVGLSVFYLLFTLIIGLRIQRLLQHRPSFSATIGELKKDRASLEEDIHDRTATPQKNPDSGK